VSTIIGLLLCLLAVAGLGAVARRAWVGMVAREPSPTPAHRSQLLNAKAAEEYFSERPEVSKVRFFRRSHP
jgi:Tfp pilus assembly protein PilE